MAERIRKTHQDEVRARIQVSALITRVQKYALGELSDEDVSSNRLNAIKLLLSKALPDLQSIELTGDKEKPLRFELSLPFVSQSMIDRNNTSTDADNRD